MNPLLRALAALLLATGTAQASVVDEAPEPSVAVQVSAARVDRNVINLTIRPYPGVKVYADSVTTQIADGPFVHDGLVAPAAQDSVIEDGHSRGLYNATAKFTLVRPELVTVPTVNVRYQACYKQTLCYPPRIVSVLVPKAP